MGAAASSPASLHGVWQITDDPCGAPISLRFCGSSERLCYLMTIVGTGFFGVPGKVYLTLGEGEVGFRGEWLRDQAAAAFAATRPETRQAIEPGGSDQCLT